MKELSNYRLMRILLVYDLPMIEDEDKKIYNVFHRNLKRLGFYMMQYSVYTKVSLNDTAYKQTEKKLKSIIPKKGNLIMMKITEKQFQDMIYLKGERNKYETIVGSNSLVVFRGDVND